MLLYALDRATNHFIAVLGMDIPSSCRSKISCLNMKGALSMDGHQLEALKSIKVESKADAHKKEVKQQEV